MSNTTLFTRPHHDITTQYLFYWNQKAVDLAAKIINDTNYQNLSFMDRLFILTKKIRFSLFNFFSHQLVDLQGSAANRLEFTHQINDLRPQLVFLNGHGSANTVTGDQNLPILDKFDVANLNGAAIYAFSCQSAKNLGPLAIQNGVKSYLGYDEDFVFIVDNHGDPSSDQTAKNFLDPAMQITYGLINGKTATQSRQDSQDAYNSVINSLSTSETSADDRQLLPYLVWNRDHQVCLE